VICSFFHNNVLIYNHINCRLGVILRSLVLLPSHPQLVGSLVYKYIKGNRSTDLGARIHDLFLTLRPRRKGYPALMIKKQREIHEGYSYTFSMPFLWLMGDKPRRFHGDSKALFGMSKFLRN
jgi:hypothetical protein